MGPFCSFSLFSSSDWPVKSFVHFFFIPPRVWSIVWGDNLSWRMPDDPNQPVVPTVHSQEHIKGWRFGRVAVRSSGGALRRPTRTRDSKRQQRSLSDSVAG